MEIGKVNGYNNFLKFEDSKEIGKKSSNDFSDLLSQYLNQVNDLQLQSEELKTNLAIGKLDNLHDLTIATEKANVSLQIVMSIRNKIVEAYKEIMRIQI